MYKVEAFIEKCLNSCLNQDISKEEYEIVCVNDGSPDKSAEIAEHIAKSNANIRVINRPNGGLSAARNTGIDNAKGEYIFFVDSDDWIADNCLGKITSILKEEKPDGIAIAPFREEAPAGNRRDTTDGLQKKEFSNHSSKTSPADRHAEKALSVTTPQLRIAHLTRNCRDMGCLNDKMHRAESLTTAVSGHA